MVWWVCGKWDLLPVSGMMWLDDGMLEGERASFYIDEVFLLVWTPTEAFMLVGVWAIASDWSGYDSWTMYSDWSELNHALWLVRTWWLKICELNRYLWLVRTWGLKICELNHELWLVRTWWVNPASWLVTNSWLKAESWLVDTNYVLINILSSRYLDYVLCI